MMGELACGNSPAARAVVDRLDGRLRVAATVAAVVTILLVRSPMVLAGLVPVVTALALVSGLTMRDLAHRLAHVEGFLVVLVVLLPLTVPGPDLIALGPIALSKAGTDRAVLVLLRVNLCAVALLTLLAGFEPVRFGHALARLGMPDKLVHLLLFAARYVALIREEAARLHDAMRARAFSAKTSRHTLRTFAYFVGQLLVRAFERAERVDEAMRCRAFTGRFALVIEDHFGRVDAVFAAALSLGLALVIIVDRLM